MSYGYPGGYGGPPQQHYQGNYYQQPYGYPVTGLRLSSYEARKKQALYVDAN